jgi:hypothetical protein
MLGGYPAREFLKWIGGIFLATSIAIFGLMYVVDNLVFPQNDFLTTQGIRKTRAQVTPAVGTRRSNPKGMDF